MVVMAGDKKGDSSWKKVRKSRIYPPYHVEDTQLVPRTAEDNLEDDLEEVHDLGATQVPDSHLQIVFQGQPLSQSAATFDNGDSSYMPRRPVLDPTTLWFDDAEVKKAVSGSIQSYYLAPWRNYGEVDVATKTHWWNMFGKKYTWSPQLEGQVRKAFDCRAGNRLRDMFYTVTKKMKGVKPQWVTEEVHKKMMAIPNADDTYKKRSTQNKLNRRGGSMDNVVEPTHFQGSISAVQHAKRMAVKNQGKLPSAPDLFLQTHFKDVPGKGKVPSNVKSKEIADTYQKKCEEASTQGSQKSPDELYWETVGGRNKKGRVSGIGQGAELYYGSHGRGSGSSQQYMPSVISQMEDHFEQRVQALQTSMDAKIESRVVARMEQMERRNKELMDEMLSRMSGFSTPNTCSTFQPQSRNPQDDPGCSGC